MIVSSLVYDCPCCGQGGLEVVLIKSNPPTEAIACSECDRIWVAPRKVGVNNDAELEIALPQLGLSGAWSNLECIHQGVPWDHLETGYQAILSSKRQA